MYLNDYTLYKLGEGFAADARSRALEFRVAAEVRRAAEMHKKAPANTVATFLTASTTGVQNRKNGHNRRSSRANTKLIIARALLRA